VRNPDYTGTFVFDNDFMALRPGGSTTELSVAELLHARGETGLCRVICFSPRHDLSLPDMDVAAVRGVVDVWAEQYLELGRRDDIGHVQIFENKGQVMGCSNPHPHGQIWANENLPNEALKELSRQRSYADQRGGCLLCDYVQQELADGTRIVTSNDEFVALVPFWAVWPFETLVLPTRHTGALPQLDPGRRDSLADVLGRLARRYDALFGVTFPYSMGFHQPPTDGELHPEWHLHAHFYPPLLRSATVRKFMVGYELLAQPQRDITPESAAQRLRDLPDSP
jgi:UDPglucose--hexose-1-phosphate uridylyltransferase